MSSSLHSSEYKELVAYLIEIRAAAGITQTALGAKLGKPQSYVSKIERCERRIDAIEFSKWAEGVGLSPSLAYSTLLKRIENIDMSHKR